MSALARLLLRGCDRVGSGAKVTGRPSVENAGRIELGARLELQSRPVTSHLVTGPQGVLRIGDDVSIGHGASIAAHREVTIGDGARLGPFVMILDTDFHEAGNHGSAGESKPIRIGRGAQLGARVTVLRGATIGEGARVLAGSVVSGEVPAGAVVSGVPARPVGAPQPEDGSARPVAEVVRRTLGLVEVPAPESGPADIPAWDSLGALNLLLSLEEEYRVSLDEKEVLHVRCVGDLAALVERARERQAA